MPLEGTSLPRALAPATPPSTSPPSRRAPFWRGAAGAVALAGWTVAGVIWAALALAPVALLERGPRGQRRARRLLPERTARPLASEPAASDGAEPVAAARAAAAGEAFPG